MPEVEKRKKSVYVGAPACFVLEQECQFLNRAFGGQCYLVGSALERSDWRDVDVRLMMDDEDFERLFPDAGINWEFDARWIVMTTAVSEQLSRKTGLPIDFQFQKTSKANETHDGLRNPLGIIFAKKEAKAAKATAIKSCATCRWTGTHERQHPCNKCGDIYDLWEAAPNAMAP